MPKSLIQLITLLAATLISAASLAANSRLNLDENDVAIGGYDPVAYFTDKKAKKGKQNFSASHDGAIYYFYSDANKAKFKENPERYLPQYGGYCAMGVALNKKLNGDPNVWRVENKKLYLNVNKDVQKNWVGELADNIDLAERNWFGIQDVSAEVLAAE